MTSHASEPVIIIGGGWAGLSAAVHLVANGHTVKLFESAKQLGGRARCVPFSGQTVDNGQHLLLGAYAETLNIMRTCDTEINKVLLRRSLVWKVRNSHGPDVQLRTPRLPAPFNFLFAILRAQGYSLAERLQTLRFMYALQRKGFLIDEDISVAALLSGQPEIVIETLWEPMCIAALNTPIDTASARIFLNVIRDSFTLRASDADTLYPIRDLGQLFVKPAIDFIESRGGQVNLAQRVDSLDIHDNRMRAVQVGEKHITASHVILAASPANSQRLLDGHATLDPISDNLKQLTYQPICTLYLQYPEEVALTEPMIGLNGMTGQWIFDRRFADQPGLMAVVISAHGAHMRLDTETLAQLVIDELSEYFDWPEPQQHLVVREKRATFSACVDVDALRPSITTPVEGLWLAGDYTRSPYPATLEGAVRSGVQCAQAIIHHMKRNPA
jgi:squalene-associated FAD-dependent desaturase